MNEFSKSKKQQLYYHYVMLRLKAIETDNEDYFMQFKVIDFAIKHNLHSETIEDSLDFLFSYMYSVHYEIVLKGGNAQSVQKVYGQTLREGLKCKTYMQVMELARKFDTRIAPLVFYPSKTNKLSFVNKVNFIIEQKAHEQCSIKTIAEELGINAKYLANRYKRNTGKTVGEAVLLKKMSIAKRRVISSEVSYVQLAYELGYETYESFYRAFKKHTGESPREYSNNKR